MDIQQLLLTMREEQRDDHRSLVEKVDTGFFEIRQAMATHTVEDTKNFAAIDNRLTPVENTRRTLRWLSAAIFVALITAAVDLIFNHFTKHP